MDSKYNLVSVFGSKKGLKESLAEYYDRSIFNMDETDYYKKKMTKKTLILNTENCRGIKIHKERIYLFNVAI